MDGVTLTGTVLVAGEARGRVLLLSEPLSLWGGLEPTTGEIVDRRHPASGQIISGRVLALPSGRGSSSASSILLEAVRLNTAPVAILTAEPDGILTLGAVVARELYGRAPAVLALDTVAYAHLRDGQHAVVLVDGRVQLTP